MFKRISKIVTVMLMSGVLVVSGVATTEVKVYATEVEDTTINDEIDAEEETDTDEDVESDSEEDTNTDEDVESDSEEDTNTDEDVDSDEDIDTDEDKNDEDRPFHRHFRRWWDRCKDRFHSLFRNHGFMKDKFEGEDSIVEGTEVEEPTTEESTEQSTEDAMTGDETTEESTEESTEDVVGDTTDSSIEESTEETEDNTEDATIGDGTAEDDCMVDTENSKPKKPECSQQQEKPEISEKQPEVDVNQNAENHQNWTDSKPMLENNVQNSNGRANNVGHNNGNNGRHDAGNTRMRNGR